MFKEGKDYDDKLYHKPGPAEKIIDGKSIKEWALELNVKTGAIYNKINLGLHPTDKMPRPGPNGGSYKGICYHEISKELGIAMNTVRNRIKKYGTPYKENNIKPIGLIEGKTVDMWAAELGVGNPTIRWRLRKYGSPHATNHFNSIKKAWHIRQIVYTIGIYLNKGVIYEYSNTNIFKSRCSP